MKADENVESHIEGYICSEKPLASCGKHIWDALDYVVKTNFSAYEIKHVHRQIQSIIETNTDHLKVSFSMQKILSVVRRNMKGKMTFSQIITTMASLCKTPQFASLKKDPSQGITTECPKVQRTRGPWALTLC